MRGMMAGAAFLAAAVAAAAADPGASGNIVFDPAKGVAGVFERQADGTIKHVQSGLICPASHPNVTFYHLLVYTPDGSDVGCDYRREDNKGGAWAKITVFAARAPGATVADIFAHYRKELMDAEPVAQSLGDAVDLTHDKSGDPLDSMRSEEFVFGLNNEPYTDQLYVTVCKGWAIVIRSTFVGPPTEVSADREGRDGAVKEAGDRVMGIKTLLGAISTICG